MKIENTWFSLSNLIFLILTCIWKQTPLSITGSNKTIGAFLPPLSFSISPPQLSTSPRSVASRTFIEPVLTSDLCYLFLRTPVTSPLDEWNNPIMMSLTPSFPSELFSLIFQTIVNIVPFPAVSSEQHFDALNCLLSSTWCIRYYSSIPSYSLLPLWNNMENMANNFW